MIPHPPVVWEQVRAVDVLFLLLFGALSELSLRGVVLSVKRKPASLRRKEDQFFKLEYDTNVLRNKGPTAFVETSKSERQLLALDKELQQLYQNRSEQRAVMEKYCMRYIRTALSVVVFLVYYGVAVVHFSGVEADKSIEVPMFFPLSVAEVGFRMISKWGLEEGAASGLGALVVMWAGSGFVAQVMEAVEHLVLQ
jgi:hypothetical protein